MAEHANNKDSVAKYQAFLALIGETSQQRVIELYNQYKGSFMGYLLGLQIPRPMPDLKSQSPQEPDSAIWQRSFAYYRSHYFDGFPLDNDYVLCSEDYAIRIESYVNRGLGTNADTIKKYLMILLDSTESNANVFRFTLSKVFAIYSAGNTQAYNNVYVFLAQKYYLNNRAPWVNQQYILQLKESLEQKKQDGS
ncbi:MAG: hypothetical protein HC896_18210 [Bacteroidales bacterium]|nr:hypothetical protein [Bacteroidales bacterium]